MGTRLELSLIRGLQTILQHLILLEEFKCGEGVSTQQTLLLQSVESCGCNARLQSASSYQFLLLTTEEVYK